MEEQLSREERFKRAKEARERYNAEKGGEYEKVEIPVFETCCLKPNHGYIVRLIGNSPEMSETDTDPVIVERSVVMGDDGKYFNLVWSNDPENPMRKLMKTVLGKYTWNSELKTRIYDNKDIPVFKKFMTNGRTDNNPINKGMMPQKYILFNCITRGKNDNWCKEHKHTKMLCWDASEKEVDGKTVVYPTYGIKPSLYKVIFDQKCTVLGVHFEDTDFLIRRFDKDTKPSDSIYAEVNSPEEKSAIRHWGEKDKEDYLSYINGDYLSDAEASYERYVLKDIPFVSAPTPISVILSKLGKFIKEVDAQFNTTLYSEFVEAKKTEIEALKAKKAEKEKEEKESDTTPATSEEDEESGDAEDNATDRELPSAVEEKPKEEAPTEQKKMPLKKVKKIEKFEITKEILEIAPDVAKLSDKEKESIVGFDEEAGEFKFKESEDELAECPVCHNMIPDPFHVCPYCGQEFQ